MEIRYTSMSLVRSFISTSRVYCARDEFSFEFVGMFTMECVSVDACDSFGKEECTSVVAGHSFRMDESGKVMGAVFSS